MSKLNITSRVLDKLGFSEYWDENGTGGCRTLAFNSGDKLRIYEQDEMDDNTEGYSKDGIYIANHYCFSSHWATPKITGNRIYRDLFFLQDLYEVIFEYYPDSLTEFIEKCIELKMIAYIKP